ncbi:MAG: tyrosine-type recombinase/integrase [Chloroflexota bacterium]
MSKLLLNNRTASTLPPRAKEYTVWDSELTGFGLRIYPTGRKTWLLRTWHPESPRKQRFTALGDAALISAQEARQEARLKLREMHLSSASQDDDNCIKFSALAARYMRDHAMLRKRSWREDERRLNKYLLPAFGDIAINKITRAHIAALHNSTGARYPFAANRLKEQLSVMFELARIWMLVPDNQANPAKLIPDFPEPKRTRWLKSHEIERLSKALHEEECPYFVAFVYLSLLTSLRKRELLNLTWQQVDGSRLEITERKNDAPLTVALPKEALALLRLLPKQRNNPYVFCGARSGKPLSDVKSHWNRLRKRANLPDVRIHDLRHTVATWLKKQGRSLNEIGDILGQKNISSTARYVHDISDASSEHLQTHAQHIAKHFNGLPNCLFSSDYFNSSFM